MKQSLAGLSIKEIEAHLSPLPSFRAKQIYKWIVRGADSFEDMTDIPFTLQKQLQKDFSIYSGAVTSCYEGGNTKKIVITLHDGFKIEAVLLSDAADRLTACISTQAGCPAGCVFCKTGSLGFIRNLESAEIAEQFLHLGNLIANYSRGGAEEHVIDNIVVMGMGEPLFNLANLKKAIIFFSDKSGLNFSRRRITVSTCGICEELFEFVKEPFARLALSLTTGDEELRQKLMPVTKNNPLEKVRQSLRIFQDNGGGRVTLEAPLLKGINTREKDAKSIADFAKGLDTVVNIIPWNPVEGLEFEGKPLCEPTKKETSDYIKMLEGYGLKVTTRLHKGKRIMGACGQLGGTD